MLVCIYGFFMAPWSYVSKYFSNVSLFWTFFTWENYTFNLRSICTQLIVKLASSNSLQRNYFRSFFQQTMKMNTSIFPLANSSHYWLHNLFLFMGLCPMDRCPLHFPTNRRLICNVPLSAISTQIIPVGVIIPICICLESGHLHSLFWWSAKYAHTYIEKFLRDAAFKWEITDVSDGPYSMNPRVYKN